MAEVDQILEWLDDLAAQHAENMSDARIRLEAQHHRDACKLIANGIRRGEHTKDYRRG